jgi:hypothetical protein
MRVLVLFSECREKPEQTPQQTNMNQIFDLFVW